jgi:hypothetical protein
MYPVSKLLKFFKLFGQRLSTETQGKQTTVRLIAVTHTCPNRQYRHVFRPAAKFDQCAANIPLPPDCKAFSIHATTQR